MSPAGAPPKVAIVTPVYNGAVYLRETMDAVQAQTWPNVVHVVLDNASTDETPAIIDSYRGARVPVLVTRNRELLSIAKNWNAAVALVPEDVSYFRTLAADDLIAPTYVERTVELAERRQDVAVVACRFHENDQPTINEGWPRDQEVISGRQVMADYFDNRCWMPSAHVLYRRSELDRRRPFFDETIVAIDLTAVMRALVGRNLGIVHEDLSMTRLHAQSVTSEKLGQLHMDMLEWMLLLREYGPFALGEEEAATRLLRYRRTYLRRLLSWPFTSHQALFKAHMKGLQAIKMGPTVSDCLDALIDWAYVCSNRRKEWRGWPLVDV